MLLSSVHGLGWREILKTQFDPMRIQIKMNRAKQSHNRRDLMVVSLSVLCVIRMVQVCMMTSTERNKPAIIR